MITYSNSDPARLRRITTTTAGVCALAGLAALVPVVEQTITVVLLALPVLAVLLGVARLLARRLRERREDAADALTAARWRATHAPRLLTDSQRDLVGHDLVMSRQSSDHQAVDPAAVRGVA